MKRTLMSNNDDIQAMWVDNEDHQQDYCTERRGDEQMCVKKNRLCMEQVKGLERHFEEENRLQAGRKLIIAEELGLEPRQVAIWFQNRRARSKAKQLERDYDKLRASFDALKRDYGSLQQEKKDLLNQLKELKSKIEENTRNTPEISRTISTLNYNQRQPVWMEELDIMLSDIIY